MATHQPASSTSKSLKNAGTGVKIPKKRGRPSKATLQARIAAGLSSSPPEKKAKRDADPTVTPKAGDGGPSSVELRKAAKPRKAGAKPAASGAASGKAGNGTPVMHLTAKIMTELQTKGQGTLFHFATLPGSSPELAQKILEVLEALNIVHVLHASDNQHDVLYLFGRHGIPQTSPTEIEILADTLAKESEEVQSLHRRVQRLQEELDKPQEQFDLPGFLATTFQEWPHLQKESPWKSLAAVVPSRDVGPEKSEPQP